jgi:hypothetical protein
MKLAAQLLFIVLLVGSSLIAWSWMINDISGEYVSTDKARRIITMSIIRKATTIKANLSLGSDALLETTAPSTASAQQLDWNFSVPQRWIEKGQTQRTVNFKGRVDNGVVTGILSNGKSRLPIKLSRNRLASIYRMFQSHLPWVN